LGREIIGKEGRKGGRAKRFRGWRFLSVKIYKNGGKEKIWEPQLSNTPIEGGGENRQRESTQGRR